MHFPCRVLSTAEGCYGSPVRKTSAAHTNEATPSLTTTVTDRLREDILGGRLLPGEKLRLEHLTTRYGSGRTPLREACSRLVAEGLVLALEQRGFRVAPISPGDLRDLTLTRQRLESIALRESILHGDPAWEARVRAALGALEKTPRSEGGTVSAKWEKGHRELHEALLSACRSPWLLRFHAILYDQSERYRRMSEVVRGPVRHVDKEHVELVRAALGRDPERAGALLVEHIARTEDRALRGHPAFATPVPAAPPAPRSKMSTKRGRPRK